jgi:hypothetical protein
MSNAVLWQHVFQFVVCVLSGVQRAAHTARWAMYVQRIIWRVRVTTAAMEKQKCTPFA